ncbi:Calponin homology (CH) domain containing protein 2 [Sarcoptes scabiei]|uniref:Calponin homology (CH) domain containing protein 2 n=1 Tax=Sarcoptes scabiei TaxID=52283 RepID=A0A131ZWN0_SARSC|nr:Calponin homology (CH) domain containing protein 2 [Sarcoptes scabiei]
MKRMFLSQHESIQKKTFTKWLNSHLSKKSERGKLRVHHFNNVARALQLFNEKCQLKICDFQIKLINISANDVVDGNHKITLGLVWCLILHWQNESSFFKTN